jgi:hypothetical protein
LGVIGDDGGLRAGHCVSFSVYWIFQAVL